MHKTLGWLCAIGITCAAGFLLWRQHDTDLTLHQETAELRHRINGLERLRDENRRLAASLPDAVELARLRADHADISRLRAEIETLHLRVQQAAPATRVVERFAEGSSVPEAEWRNAGTATARATLETVLWAAAGGDVDAFANCLLLPEGRVRQRATALLESLPADVREQYSTPERLVAFLAIKDVPLGTADVLGWDDNRTSTPTAQVQLSAASGQPKGVRLRFSQDGGGWKLVVPFGAVVKYAAFLDLAALPAPVPPRPAAGIQTVTP